MVGRAAGTWTPVWGRGDKSPTLKSRYVGLDLIGNAKHGARQLDHRTAPHTGLGGQQPDPGTPMCKIGQPNPDPAVQGQAAGSWIWTPLPRAGCLVCTPDPDPDPWDWAASSWTLGPQGAGPGSWQLDQDPTVWGWAARPQEGLGSPQTDLDPSPPCGAGQLDPTPGAEPHLKSGGAVAPRQNSNSQCPPTSSLPT